MKNRIKNWLGKYILPLAFISTTIVPKVTREGKKKLLIVRMDAIGDFILFSPMLPYYRELFKEYEITLLVNNINDVFAERYIADKIIDHVIVFDRGESGRRFLYNRNLFKTIRNSGFDIAIYPTYSREILGDYMIAVSGAPVRIGYDGDYRNISRSAREKTDAYYTQLILASPGIILEPKRNKEFVERLALKFGLKLNIDNYLSVFKPNADDIRAAELILNKEGFDPSKNYIVVCPGTSDPKRNWPVEKFAEVIRHLHQAYKIETIICGSAKETVDAQAIQKNVSFPVIDLTGKETLSVFGAICKKAELYVGGDTGTTHIASAVGLPIVCIMGGGIGRFFPYGNPKTHVAVYDKAIYALTLDKSDLRYQMMHGTEKNVQVAQVLEAVQEILKNTSYAAK